MINFKETYSSNPFMTFKTGWLTVFCIAFVFFDGCKRPPEAKKDNSAVKFNVDSLIAVGQANMNTHTDLLLPVADKLMQVARQTNNKTALVYSEQFSANYYWLAADHKRSMAMAVKCLADAEKAGIKASLPETYIIMASLHKENTNYKMAFDAQEKGLQWAKANRDTGAIISLLSLKAMLIHTSRNQPHATPYKDTSINIQLTTLPIGESNVKYERRCIPLYDNISQYFLNKAEYDKAIYYGEKGASLALKYDQQRSLTYSYSWLGMAWYLKGNKTKGLDYLNKALLITRALKEPYREMEIYEHLYDCYYSSGDFKTAISYFMHSAKMRDSLQVVVNEKQISEYQIKYESIKKDNEIARMDRSASKQNKELLLISAGCLLLLVFFFILVMQYRILHQNAVAIKKSNEQKGKALENIAFIQAHELRKPVASVLGLINVIKASDHEVDREMLKKLEEAAQQLDSKIRDIITHVEGE